MLGLMNEWCKLESIRIHVNPTQPLRQPVLAPLETHIDNFLRHRLPEPRAPSADEVSNWLNYY
jgi:hypothetical protein